MTDSEQTLDFKITSTRDLRSLVEKCNQVIAEREALQEDTDALAKVSELIDHIDSEIDGPAVAAYDLHDHLPPLSLEHLELYENYLLRLEVPDTMQEQHQRVLTKVSDALKSHPLAEAPRSGDRAGNEHGSASFYKVPAGRRRQTCVLLYFNLLTGPMLILLVCLLFALYFPYSPYFIALYIGWCTYDNFTRPLMSPNRISERWRRHAILELFRDYFPIRMIKANKTEEYSPEKNFLFCYHPHGVQSAGCFSFGSAATGFDILFPGLKAHIQTLSINFRIPFYRESLIGLGAGDASRETLKLTLSAKNPGHCAVLVTGGALESMYTTPYQSKVVLKSRAGFVKIALQTGASLVPVWGFGENNLYENLAAGSPSILRWQRKIQRVISFAPLLVAGRGVFTYSGGLLPRRRPISVVVGAPIDVGPAEANPSPERINEVHKQYKKAVDELFNKYRDIYDPKAHAIEFV